jgi:hypothetical protein
MTASSRIGGASGTMPAAAIGKVVCIGAAAGAEA